MENLVIRKPHSFDEICKYFDRKREFVSIRIQASLDELIIYGDLFEFVDEYFSDMNWFPSNLQQAKAVGICDGEVIFEVKFVPVLN